MTQILGFAGKKQSGKNTACNYIIALKLVELGVSKKTRLAPNGMIEVSDIFGETKGEQEWFEFSEKNLNIDKLFNDGVGQYVRIYGLADTLKDMCINVFGLTYHQAYGRDKDKNSETDILWGNVPTPNSNFKNKKMTDIKDWLPVDPWSWQTIGSSQPGAVIKLCFEEASWLHIKDLSDYPGL